MTETTAHWDWMREQWSIERERSAAYIAERRASRTRAAQPARLPVWARPVTGAAVLDESDNGDGEDAETMEALPAL